MTLKIISIFCPIFSAPEQIETAASEKVDAAVVSCLTQSGLSNRTQTLC